MSRLGDALKAEFFRAVEGGASALFRPFELAVERVAGEDAGGVDGVLIVRWAGRTRRFGFQCKRTWSRRSLEQLQEEVTRRGLVPLIVTPYLSDRQLDEVEAVGVSGIDLNGNGVLSAPPDLYARRTGAKNEHKVRSPAENIYRSWKVASLVPRVLVTKGRFVSVQSVLEACHARMMPGRADEPLLRLSTVSKALSQLEEDLVIERRGREVRLIDPERLIDSLARAYRAPVAATRFVGRMTGTAAEAWAGLRVLPGVRVVTTGRGSAPCYTDLAGAERLALYVSAVAPVRDALKATPTEIFPNLELIETGEEGVYFDARAEDGVSWASPVQAYLELSTGGAREALAARALRGRLLQQMRDTRE